MHLIFVLGYAGSGKTTTVRRLLALDAFEAKRLGNAAWVQGSRMVIFGRWHGYHKDTAIANRLDGTDRIHRSAVSACTELLSRFAQSGVRVVVVEGFRLFRRTFIDEAMRIGAAVTFLELSTPRVISFERMLRREAADTSKVRAKSFDRWEAQRAAWTQDARWRTVEPDDVICAVERTLHDQCTPPDPGDLPHPPVRWRV